MTIVAYVTLGIFFLIFIFGEHLIDPGLASDLQWTGERPRTPDPLSLPTDSYHSLAFGLLAC